MIEWIQHTFGIELEMLRSAQPAEMTRLLRENAPVVWESVSPPDFVSIKPEERKVVHSFLNSFIYVAPPDFTEQVLNNLLEEAGLDIQDIQQLHIVSGMFYANNHRYPESIRHFQEALIISANPGALETADRIMNYLGVVYYRMGELQKALEAHEQSLNILATSENEERKAIYFNNLGIVQKEIGLTREAAESFKRALPIMRKLNRPDFLAVLYMNIGTVYSKLERYEDSLNFQKEALKLYREAGQKLEECNALTNIGNILRDMEDYAEASKTIKETLKLAQENDFKFQQAVNLYNLGLLHKKIGEYAEAENNFTRSAEISEKIDDKEGIWRAYLELGDLKRESNDFNTAFIYLKKAESIFESMRKDLKADRDRVAFLSNQKELLEKLVFLEYERKSENFWGTVQNVKSRSLRELLLGTYNNPDEHHDSTWSEEKASELWKKDQLEMSDCLVDFFVGKESLIRFVYHPDFGLKQTIKKISQKKISDEVDKIYDEIKILESMGGDMSIYAYAASMEQLWRKPYENLYFLLFSDIENELKPFDQLIINPHGALHKLPFSALQSSHGPLVTDHSVILTPSLPLLEWQLSRPVNFDDGLKLFITSPDELATLTREEGRQLSTIVGDGILVELGEKIMVKTPARFTGDLGLVLSLDEKQNFKKNLSELFGNLSLFHFAGHGVYEPSEPMYSYLQIAPDLKITSEEFYRGDFHSDRMKLVALSACETGRLKVSEGDEIWGFARALFGSGARSLLLSLWKVEDHAGHDLMLEFYYNMFQQDLPLGRSLGCAQRRILEQTSMMHPFFWAPFQLYGSP